MGHEHFRPLVRRYEPVASDRRAGHFGNICPERLLPALKVHSSRERSKRHEMGKGQAGFLGQVQRRVEGLGTISHQSKNEGAQHVHAVLAKLLEPFYQAIAGAVEVLENGLESLRSYRL